MGSQKLIVTILALVLAGCGNAFHAGTYKQQSQTHNSVTCNDSPAGHSPLQLLSTRQYDNALSDLLSTTKKASELGNFTEQTAGPSGYLNDTSLIRLTAADVEKYWLVANTLADDVVASKASAAGAYAKIAGCARGVTGEVPAACRDSVIRDFVMRAWRRPLIESGPGNEMVKFTAYFNETANFDDGLRAMIAGALISPNFMFHAITSDQPAAAGTAFELNEFQLASRLSFFLWESIPDAELLNLAKAGTLKNRATLEAQVTRMLRDPRSQRLADVLLNEWLRLSEMQIVTRNGLTEDLRAAMIQESKLLVDEIIRNDLPMHRLINADTSKVNQLLANHYGLSFPAEADPASFVQASLAGSPRRGILGMGAFLTATAGGADETHPTKRGKMIANRVVCADIPAPPDLINPDPNDIAALPPFPTPREKLVAHTKNPACFSCHQHMDPYGFALETFDVVGKWRPVYPAPINRAVDPASVLPDGTALSGSAQMFTHLAASPSVKACLARQLVSLAAARVVDRCAGAKMNVEGSFSNLVKQVVQSAHFKTQTGEAQ